MLQSKFKRAYTNSLLLSFFLLTIFSLPVMAGGDTYQIYLNKVLVIKFPFSQSQKDCNLQLTRANYNDNLVISYSHCGVTGTGRSIVLKNEQNQVIKEWKFADTEDTKTAMSVSIKEIMELHKNNSGSKLSLYYVSSRMLPQGKLLTSLTL
ncbi:MAG TPA: hypothetical protein PLA68_13955 [Panacibacter sp.]|nr:hypothetical protein [Panacibacter sp.]